MNISKNGLKFIRLHEGVRNKAYLDPIGVLTIGVGFTNRSNSFKEWWNKNRTDRFSIHSVMSDAEIDSALEYLISKEYGKAVNDFLNNKTIPQHVYDAAVSAVFNLGPGALNWKWAQELKRGDYLAASWLLSKTGTTANGKKLAGLVRRRKEEALLMSDGIYTGVKTSVEPKPPVVVTAPVEKPTKKIGSPLAMLLEMFFNLFRKRR